MTKLKLRNNHFSHIFIDEASQSTELETLIPLAVTSLRDKSSGEKLSAQIVIAGDPYQLGPIVKCKKIEHLLGNYNFALHKPWTNNFFNPCEILLIYLGQSLLERLLECEPYQKVNDKYNPRYITKLLRNYRSRDAILHISNKFFYGGELLCCSDKKLSKVTSNWLALSQRTFPIIFFVVKGEEIRTPSMR